MVDQLPLGGGAVKLLDQCCLFKVVGKKLVGAIRKPLRPHQAIAKLQGFDAVGHGVDVKLVQVVSRQVGQPGCAGWEGSRIDGSRYPSPEIREDAPTWETISLKSGSSSNKLRSGSGG
jgi:hypothetical protein